jgi:hypothetical protein
MVAISLSSLSPIPIARHHMVSEFDKETDIVAAMGGLREEAARNGIACLTV